MVRFVGSRTGTLILEEVILWIGIDLLGIESMIIKIIGAGSHPMMDLKRRLSVKDLQGNAPQEQDGSVAFFSGGVDAFCTLISHREEKPTLITLWGSDISVEDIEGWKKEQDHFEDVSHSFSVDYVVVKSSFRIF